jgi:hypothetical protein
MEKARRGSFPILDLIKSSKAERKYDTNCEQFERCLGNESIADGGIPFRHELVQRNWITLQVPARNTVRIKRGMRAENKRI